MKPFESFLAPLLTEYLHYRRELGYDARNPACNLRVFDRYLVAVNAQGDSLHALTRFGIYRICKKYLQQALPAKRLPHLHPVHSFRHSRAVDMLREGKPVTDIRNHLGHDNVQTTMLYLHLDLNRRRDIQQRFLRHMEALLKEDPKINELLGWENDQDLMRWLDTL